MPVVLYNSLTRSKEEFVPQRPPEVLFYNCGPTVYGEFHIGNARNFVAFDVVRRWLEARGFKVQYVQNITDVDDKIIARAAEEGMEPAALAEKYTAYFLAKLEELGNLPATSHPRATEYIGPIIGMIKRLVDSGHAYASDDGSVWFSVSSFPEYGKLSRMPLDQMQQGERLDAGQQALKRSPVDFSLWKAAKPGEPAWDSPWGKGRPGWHIECSCMSMKALGSETIDIHGGGVDLRFPHHENEIAQSEAATGKPFSRYWMHNGMLDIDGEKMSKSLGNIRSIDDVLAIMDPMALRYFLISARYRDKLDFTEDNLNKCRSAVERMVLACREARRVLAGTTVDDGWGEDAELKALHEEFASAMDDDFNTPRALGALAKAVTLLNRERTAVESGEAAASRLAQCETLVAKLRGYLGLGAEMEPEEEKLAKETVRALKAFLSEIEPSANIVGAAEAIDRLMEARAAARKAKQFARADEIRNRLNELGIALEDKPGGGTVWRRKSEE